MRYISVSGILEQYKPKFRREHWQSVSATKGIIKPKEYNALKDLWFEQGFSLLDDRYPGWLMEQLSPLQQESHEAMIEKINHNWIYKNETSVVKGNAVHDKLEKLAYSRGSVKNPIDQSVHKVFQKEVIAGQNAAIMDDLSKLEPMVYPELLVWYTFPKAVYDPILDCKIGGIAGQIDLPFIYKEGLDRFISISDFKTNEEISKWPIKWKNHGYIYWNFPMHKVADSKLDYYRFQLSFYTFLMEQWGFKPGPMMILHKKENIKLEYARSSVASMLSYYYQNLSEERLPPFQSN